MAEHGICAWLYDPDQHLSVTPAFAADIRALGATHVRVAIRGNLYNGLDYSAYRAALQVYKDAGLHVLALLDCDFNRPWLEGKPSRDFYPNQALGYQHNRRWNRWIKDSMRRGTQAARELGHLVDAWALHNEPNLQALCPVGTNVPPVAGSKSPAMAPRVFLSYGWEMEAALRAGGAQTIYLGALSWIAGSGPDALNPFCAGYLHEGLAYLASTFGGQAWQMTTRWAGLLLNCEGWWTQASATAMQAAIRRVLAPYDMTLPLLISEWGEENRHLAAHQAAVEPTHAALSGVAERLYFFSYQADKPYNLDGFGAQLVTTRNGGYYPAFAPLAWRAPLETIYHRT